METFFEDYFATTSTRTTTPPPVSEISSTTDNFPSEEPTTFEEPTTKVKTIFVAEGVFCPDCSKLNCLNPPEAYNHFNVLFNFDNNYCALVYPKTARLKKKCVPMSNRYEMQRGWKYLVSIGEDGSVLLKKNGEHKCELGSS